MVTMVFRWKEGNHKGSFEVVSNTVEGCLEVALDEVGEKDIIIDWYVK